ncbi:lipase chaperone [Babesia caballi]|uniref:Lipase chaperone n=1 Tax=Babesia caballi TaxID=5871 RepID=A0AAV4LN72_BABCB|nr:lipase chaperone [Babesia caballi]
MSQEIPPKFWLFSGGALLVVVLMVWYLKSCFDNGDSSKAFPCLMLIAFVGIGVIVFVIVVKILPELKESRTAGEMYGNLRESLITSTPLSGTQSDSYQPPNVE